MSARHSVKFALLLCLTSLACQSEASLDTQPAGEQPLTSSEAVTRRPRGMRDEIDRGVRADETRALTGAELVPSKAEVNNAIATLSITRPAWGDVFSTNAFPVT